MSALSLACKISRTKLLNKEFSFKYLVNSTGRCFTNGTNLQQAPSEVKTNINNGPIPFLRMMENRKLEAERSILVQVQSSQSCKELYSYCSSYGNVQNMFHYTTGVEPLHFIIVEFSNKLEVLEILNQSSYLLDSDVMPVQSNFLWFKAGKKSKLKQSKQDLLRVENGNSSMGPSAIRDILTACDSVSGQMIALYNAVKLNEVATRLRFLTARQIQMCMTGLFPNAAAYPFGSSVNGFGKMGCDLDVVLRLYDQRSDGSKEEKEKRLIYHCKAINGFERSVSVRQMEVIGDLLQLFLPGCAQVRKILQARVPIIKYYQQFTDVECDLSMSNMSGVCMSDLLYIFGSIDFRVRPLVFTVRNWAHEIGLTNSSPGRWITNFSLTLLVLGFLQSSALSPAIIPTVHTLVKHAEPSDKYVTEDGVNCTFLRDITKLNFKTRNTESLETLFKQFCEFYSTFEFRTKAVSLNHDGEIPKPDHSALYIVNPLERGLNVSKNVSLEELEKFRFELRNAIWSMESQENKPSWGLLDLFNNRKRKYGDHFIVPDKQGRLMEVSKLFEEEEQEDATKNIVYKNEIVEKQVEDIKKKTKETLSLMSKQNTNR